MPTTEKKKRRRPPNIKASEYVLVYTNLMPNKVKPRQICKPKKEPFSFIMQQKEIFDIDDDTI